MKLMQLPLGRLTLHPDCQARDATDTAYAAEIAEYLGTRDAKRRWRQTKPVEAVQSGDTIYLWDGYHRLEGHRLATPRRRTILVSVRPGTLRDAILLATSANRDHGLRRTNADKRRAVLLLLTDEEWGDRVKWPNRRVAEHCGVGPDLVRLLRDELARMAGGESETAAGENGVESQNQPGESQKRKRAGKGKARVIDELARRRGPRAKKFRDLTPAEQEALTLAEREACRAGWRRDLKAHLEAAERLAANLADVPAALAGVRAALAALAAGA